MPGPKTSKEERKAKPEKSVKKRPGVSHTEPHGVKGGEFGRVTHEGSPPNTTEKEDK